MWKIVRLGDVCTISSSKRIFAKEYKSEGIPFYRGKEVIEKHNGNNVSTELYISKERYDEIKSKYDVPGKGDILLTSVGTLGIPWLVDEEDFYFKDGNLTWLRCNTEIVPEYLYLWLNSAEAQNQIDAKCIGSTQKALTIETLNKFQITLPSFELQKKIVSIIAPIESKISRNRKINENLLQQLHVLYSRLFCDSAMDTPLGDVVATTSGGTPSRKHDEYYSDSSICWVKSKELIGNYIHETEEHINDLAIKKSSAKLLPEHSVLIAMYGATVGAYGVISKPMTCNQAVCALLCNENYPYTYLFQIAYESQQKFINLAVGSAQQNISQVLIKQLNLHSDLDIIQRFHDLALPMHQEIEFLQAENIRLSDLRDNLLPKLMSGELDVSNVEI